VKGVNCGLHAPKVSKVAVMKSVFLVFIMVDCFRRVL
jgi:hypothetical protein